MSYSEKDEHSGAIIFRKTEEEKRIDALEKRYLELERKYEEMEDMLTSLQDKVR